ncbi:MAG: hypothetical protein D3908_12045, partial [Candidatus Electrothrix sp. AUS4]|nr:hypothetical protein [Candidatus Electrothrix sp. AUS4]
MKEWKKKIVISIGGALAALLAGASSSIAYQIGTCTINNIAVTEFTTSVSSNYVIYAACPGKFDGQRYFYFAKSDHAEGYYATALTAVSNGTN